MMAKSENSLLKHDALEMMKQKLFPITTLLTPNLSEASILVQREVRTKNEMEQAALEIIGQGPQAVLIKGGHLQHDISEDVLCIEGNELHWFAFPKIKTNNTHGTGCTFSAAIASFLAQGMKMFDAVAAAKAYISQCIVAAAPLKIGQGHGPVHHFFSVWDNQPRNN